MSSKLSPTARAAIRTGLSVALAASRTPATASAASDLSAPDAPTPPRTQPRRGRPVRVDVADLIGCFQRAAAQADAHDQRPQRPMVGDTPFEEFYRDYQRRHDRLSCFLACLAGSLGYYVPEAGHEISVFLDHDHAANAQERTITCQQ